MCSISNGTLDTPLAHERRLFSRMFSGILAALARASVRFPPAGLATRPWPWAPWSPSGPRGPTGPMGPMPTWDPRRNTTSRKCAAEPSVKETSQYIYICMYNVCLCIIIFGATCDLVFSVALHRTMMLKNIPCRKTQEEVMEHIDSKNFVHRCRLCTYAKRRGNFIQADLFENHTSNTHILC